MMNRRFVNLVLENYKSNMYALHRLDVSKHLFYPSTAEAEAAHAAKEKETNNGGSKPNPLRIERLRRLPPLITGFESPASRPQREMFWHPDSDDMFVVLNGGGRPGGERGSRILHANGAGHAAIYDADSRSVVCVPDLTEPKGFRPMPFVVPGAGAGAGEDDESLYVLRSLLVKPSYHTERQCSHNFEVLDFGVDGKDSFYVSRSNLLKWQPLPAPPLSSDNLDSSTVIDGGRTICVSAMSSKGGTYCFNTATREWRHAGNWQRHPHHLCSTDLTGVAAMAPNEEPPTLQHVWEDFTPPPTVKTSLVLNKRFPDIVRRTRLDWTVDKLHLVNLGSGRLCIVKVFDVEETVSLSYSFDHYEELKGKLTVLVDVEVVRGGDGGLRIVKHRTKRFAFPGNCISCVI